MPRVAQRCLRFAQAALPSHPLLQASRDPLPLRRRPAGLGRDADPGARGRDLGGMEREAESGRIGLCSVSSPKSPSASRVEMTQLVLPSETNSLGTAFGGKIMQWIDLAAGVAARRHAGCVAVTASMDGLQFGQPVQLGDVVVLHASVNRVWRTSMEVGVRVDCEPLRDEQGYRAARAYLTFVALDKQGRPKPVPQVVPETPRERERYERAEERRARRLADRKRQSGDATPEPPDLDAIVGRVVARLAHDINNPMSVVLSNLRFLEGELGDPELREAADESAVSAERVTRVIDAAASLAGLRSGHIKPKRAEVSLEELRQTIERHIGIRLGSRRLDWRIKVGRVVMDQALLQRALLAVLDHCVSRSPPGDTICVEMSGKKGVTIRVSDGAPPFSPDQPPSFVGDRLPVGGRPDKGCRSDEGLGLYFAGIAARAMGARVAVRADKLADKERVVFEMVFPPYTLGQDGD